MRQLRNLDVMLCCAENCISIHWHFSLLTIHVPVPAFLKRGVLDWKRRTLRGTMAAMIMWTSMCPAKPAKGHLRTQFRSQKHLFRSAACMQRSKPSAVPFVDCPSTRGFHLMLNAMILLCRSRHSRSPGRVRSYIY